MSTPNPSILEPSEGTSPFFRAVMELAARHRIVGFAIVSIELPAIIDPLHGSHLQIRAEANLQPDQLLAALGGLHALMGGVLNRAVEVSPGRAPQ